MPTTSIWRVWKLIKIFIGNSIKNTSNIEFLVIQDFIYFMYVKANIPLTQIEISSFSKQHVEKIT